MSKALLSYLTPIARVLDEEFVSEICINKPGEMWVEKRGKFERTQEESLTYNRIKQLAELIAEYNRKELSETKPLLSATLPTGERCQFVLPPACDIKQAICSIRKPSRLKIPLKDWFKDTSRINKPREKEIAESKLVALYQDEAFYELVFEAVRLKKNVIISGGTSTAKTTFFNSCLDVMGLNERLLTIEGVREADVAHPNRVHLVANEDSSNNPNGATMLDLLKAALRLRPDRVILSELRNEEAYTFLRASISGHPGSLTTLHADNIEHAKEQLKFMLSESRELQAAPESRLEQIIKSSVDVIVQMERDDLTGERFIRELWMKGVSDG